MPYGMDAFMLGIGMLGMCQACTCASSGPDLLPGLPRATWVSHLFCGLPS